MLREMETTTSFLNMARSTVLPILVQFVAILMGCSTVAAQTQLEEFVPGKLISGSLRAFTYISLNCDGTFAATCGTCNSIKICGGPGHTPTRDCPAAFSHCNLDSSATGAFCSKTPDPAVPGCSAVKFTCTGVGFYPDAYSCQLYYYCSAPEATPEVYTCQTGYKFNSKTSACALSATPCPAVSCKFNNPDAVFLPHPVNSQYYVYCYYEQFGAAPILVDTIVFSCGEGGTFNPTTQKCVFTCPKEGFYPNTAYPRRYYQCYMNAGKLIYREMLCATNQMYDTIAKKCVAAPNIALPQ